jgi:glycosyltransferase involved in cell wall biosynthesis
VNRSYFYLGGDELHSGMYISLLRKLEREGLVVHLVSRLRVSLNPRSMAKTWQRREWLGPNPLASLRTQIQGGVYAVPLWAPAAGLSLPALSHIVDRHAGPDDTVVLHARQVVMVRLAFALQRQRRGVRIITELEGDALAEAQYSRIGIAHPSPRMRARWWFEDRYYPSQERRMVRDSDAILCVTQKLKDVLIRRYHLSDQRAGRIFVFPSVGDPSAFRFDPEQRAATRRRLGIDGRYVVVYSGNLGGRWQVPDKLVEVFAIIRRRRADAFFLVLTPEKDRPRIEPLIREAGISAADHFLGSCRHDEVAQYLCAGDVGLLLRDRHLMNEVAAPGKFSEYMLTGMPIVLTEGIGDFSDQMRDSTMACLLPDLHDLEAQAQRIQAFCDRPVTAAERTALSLWAAGRFSTDLRISQLASLYRSV